MSELFNGKTVEELDSIGGEASKIGTEHNPATGYEMRMAYVEAIARAIAEPGWVSVKEQQPMNATEYLCYANHGLYLCAFWNGCTQEWDVYNRGTAQWEQFEFDYYRSLSAPPSA